MLQDELVAVSTGIGIVGLIAVLLVALVLFAGLRGWRLAVPILVTLCAGLAWTAGFAALAVGELNIISITFAVLFIGLSVDFGIHYALRVQERQAEGLPQRPIAAAPAPLPQSSGLHLPRPSPGPPNAPAPPP